MRARAVRPAAFFGLVSVVGAKVGLLVRRGRAPCARAHIIACVTMFAVAPGSALRPVARQAGQAGKRRQFQCVGRQPFAAGSVTGRTAHVGVRTAAARASRRQAGQSKRSVRAVHMAATEADAPAAADNLTAEEREANESFPEASCGKRASTRKPHALCLFAGGGKSDGFGRLWLSPLPRAQAAVLLCNFFEEEVDIVSVSSDNGGTQ